VLIGINCGIDGVGQPWFMQRMRIIRISLILAGFAWAAYWALRLYEIRGSLGYMRGLPSLSPEGWGALMELERQQSAAIGLGVGGPVMTLLLLLLLRLIRRDPSDNGLHIGQVTKGE
jgi:hypothetical protein